MSEIFICRLAELENIILKLRDELKRYVLKPDASELFIEKQNQLISDLCNIYNSFEQMRCYELWMDIERRIDALEKKDPQLNAHVIIIHTKPAGSNYSYIDINPFAQ